MKTKSKIMARAAKKEGIPVEKLHMPKVEPKDLKGLPFVASTKPIGIKPYDPDFNHRNCNVKGCEETPVSVVRGSYNCNYCGNEVNLCREHTQQLIAELTALL